MAIAVKMPRQGQSVETCIITRWYKKKGDIIKSGDMLFSYETDKSSFDFEAENEGILLDIFFNEGDEVPVLTNVAVLGTRNENTESLRPELSSPNMISNVSASHTSVPEPPLKQAEDAVLHISPRARIMASGLGIKTIYIKGTGPNGRIIVRDVEEYNKLHGINSISGSSPEYEEIKQTNVRKLIASAMMASISNSAQLTHHLSADISKIQSIRYNINTDTHRNGTIHITINDMICFAVLRALKLYPGLNSHLIGDSIRIFKNVHLGIAVDTPRGLMVPALQNADTLNIYELSSGLKELAERCKKGNMSPELLKGPAASFTVSNLGNYGVEMFTPILNLPQIAILGVNTIIYRPVGLGNGIFKFIPMIGLSLTYDHRAIDGGPASLFLKEIKNQIENFVEV